MPKPLRRHISLQPISHEHHHGLWFAWNIKAGIKKKVSVERMVNYADWFWNTHLETHFLFEEKYMFPILGSENPSVIKAIDDHQTLKKLFQNRLKDVGILDQIATSIKKHIRFEERILFEEIQEEATNTQLQLIEQAHAVKPAGCWSDEFWILEE